MREAIQDGDSQKIQVYIRALGNSAHPEILKVYEPYLEGKEPMSDYQRLVIVASLDRMTKVYPKLARSVLYKIYQNTGDASEVRVAAVMQLMKTNPPAEMIQRMAQFTNLDHNDDVNAAVKSAIESAANIQNQYNLELANNAKSAVHLLTKKDYGFHNSKHYIRSFLTQEQKLGYTTRMTSIQSDDSIIPSSLLYSLRYNLGGFKKQLYQFAAMTSSADDLIDLLSEQFESNQEQKAQGRKSAAHHEQSEWTTDKVRNMLNIEVDDADQVEGNLLLTFQGTRRFFAFDNHTIEMLPQLVKNVASSLHNGENFNYTKLYNQQVIKIGFPTATGLPFVYSIQIPTLISIGGEARLQSHPDLASGSKHEIRIPRTLNITSDLKFTYSAKVQSKMGFITPFSHQRYLAGYDSNTHIHLPIRAKIDVDLSNTKVYAKVQPLYPNKYQKLAEYSTQAYTTKHDILDLTPPQNDEQTEITHIRPIKRIEATVGEQQTGFAFDMKAETEQKYFDWAYYMNGLQRHDIMSALIHYNKEKVIKPYVNYTLAYNPQKTTAKYVRLSMDYEQEIDYKNKNNEENKHNLAIPSSSSPNSEKRMQQFLQRAGAGIQDSRSQVVDLSVEFDGQTSAQYVATAAYGRSQVSPKSRFLLFLSKVPAKTSHETRPYQVALEVNTKVPVVPLANYKKALHAEPSSYMTAQLNIGEKAESGYEIKIKGKMEQTEERKRYVEQLPMSQVCEKQMQEGNYILQACRNVTARANYLDHYHFTVEYQKVPEGMKNATYKAYSMVRHLAYPYVSENFVNASNDKNKIELDVNFAVDFKAVNVSIDTPAFSSVFSNLRINQWIKPIVTVHPEYNALERIGQKALFSQQYPTCVIDKTYATTFDNKTYPIHLGKCWHVMFHYTPQPHYDSSSASSSSDDYEAVSVLVRDLDSNKRELMFILGEYVVYFYPSTDGTPADYFTVNGEKIRVVKDAMAHYEDKRGNTLIQVYKLPTGAYRVYTPEHGFEVIYDGLRVKFQAPNNYRGDVRGLCGTFDGERETDFTSPQSCVLKKPQEFAASYAIADGSCQGQAKELHQRVQSAECYKKNVMLGDVISEKEAGRLQNRQRNQGRKANLVKAQNKSSCTSYRVKVLEENGKVCFSLKPQPTCVSSCQPTKMTEQKVEFHCVSDTRAARNWVEMAKKGTHLDFSKKASNHKANIMLPKSCVSQ